MDEALEAIKASARGNQGLQRKIETLEKNAAFQLYQAESMKLRLSEEERAERDEQVRISRKKYEAQLDRHAREVVRQGEEHANRRIKIAEDMQDFFEQKLKQAVAQRDWYIKRDKSMWKQIAEHHKAGERIEAAWEGYRTSIAEKVIAKAVVDECKDFLQPLPQLKRKRKKGRGGDRRSAISEAMRKDNPPPTNIEKVADIRAEGGVALLM